MSGRASAVGWSLWLALGCTGPGEASGPAAEPTAAEDPHGHDEHEGHAAGSAWAEVQAPRDATLLEAPATVRAQANARARIDVPYRATVMDVRVRVGDRVEVGDAMVEVAMPALLEAAAVLSGTNDQIDTHRRRKDRLDDLHDKGLVGAGEVFDVERQLGALSAERGQALATFRAAGVDPRQRAELLRRGTAVLRAPVAGVVAHLDATPGAVVEPGGSLATVLGTAPVRVEVVLSEPLPPGLELRFEGSDGLRFALRSEPVATAIEPGLGRTLAWYEPIDGEPRADGLRGRVIVGGALEGLLQVPRAALRLHEGRAFVARRRTSASEPSAPEPVEVEVVRSSGASALVRSDDLHVGDAVAIDTATVLLLGRDPDELAGGHHH